MITTLPCTGGLLCLVLQSPTRYLAGTDLEYSNHGTESLD